MEAPAAPPPAQERQAAADIGRSEDKVDMTMAMVLMVLDQQVSCDSAAAGVFVVYSHSFGLLLQPKVPGVGVLKHTHNTTTVTTTTASERRCS